MTKSATDVMEQVIVAAVLDALAALKTASKGMPNTLLRDIGAIHGNTTFADLPAEVQRSITASVRAAFTRLLKEGYSVSPAGSAPPRGAPVRREVPRREGPRRDGPRREGPPHGRGPRGPGQKPGDRRPPRKGAPQRGPPRGK